MATSYSFEVGYLSGHTTDIDRDDAWKQLKAVCSVIATSPQHLLAECERDIQVEPEFVDESYLDFAKIYSADQGNPISCDETRQAFFICLVRRPLYCRQPRGRRFTGLPERSA